MTKRYPSLSAERALIWRLTHRANLTWIFRDGLHCANASVQVPGFVAIGNADVIQQRRHRRVSVPPGGTLADYVPFYFTPFSVMMYNIVTGRGVRQQAREDLVLLVSSIPRLTELDVDYVFTDGHASMAMTRFYNDPLKLGAIDWDLLQRRDFKRDDNDPRKLERYQAEALVHGHVPVEALLGVICYDAAIAANVVDLATSERLAIDVHARRGWYL